MGDPRTYSDVIVRKPWGSEYLVFSNAHAALWHLRLRAGCQTSLHCHPRKKTALILLNGAATVRFLNNQTVLRGPANLMIRPGLFHSTAADQGMDVDVLELESPVDKTNIVRLEDSYGRAAAPYEGDEHTSPLDDTCLRLPAVTPGSETTVSLCGRRLQLFFDHDSRPRLAARPSNDILVVLEGGLFSGDGQPVLGPGDAVSVATASRLTAAFQSPEGLSGLLISSEP